MILVDNVEVFNFEGAIRGMRNPLNSWSKSDSYFEDTIDVNSKAYAIGENDLSLMRRLYKAGPEHRKYLRQIMVSMDITAPLYWWAEYDTYKVGTVANSCSRMHTLHKKEISPDLFSLDGGIELDEYQYEVVDRYFHVLEDLRKNCKSGDAKWRTLLQYLPESFNQKRTVTMNYENVISMIKQRTGHKLDEWNEFVEVLKSLPYVKEILDEQIH